MLNGDHTRCSPIWIHFHFSASFGMKGLASADLTMTDIPFKFGGSQRERRMRDGEPSGLGSHFFTPKIYLMMCKFAEAPAKGNLLLGILFYFAVGSGLRKQDLRFSPCLRRRCCIQESHTMPGSLNKKNPKHNKAAAGGTSSITPEVGSQKNSYSSYHWKKGWFSIAFSISLFNTKIIQVLNADFKGNQDKYLLYGVWPLLQIFRLTLRKNRLAAGNGLIFTSWL